MSIKTAASTAVLLFVVCFLWGIHLARLKPFWNDEIYTQTRIIDSVPVKDILLANMGEGNNCPLFYLLQKGVCGIFSYRLPVVWQGEPFLSEPRGQVILRLTANAAMSLMIALIFYFFARHYSLAAGIYSFLVSISSLLVWGYWAEARPYALWMVLTAAQMILFLRLLQQEKVDRLLWRILVAVHFLLAASAIISVAQIVIVSFLLWVYREKNWKLYGLLTFFPSLICFYYYAHAPIVGYSVSVPERLILENIPLERLLLIFVGGGALFWTGKKVEGTTAGESRIYFQLTLGILLTGVALIGVMMLKASGNWDEASSRVLIHLTPVGIIAVALISWQLVKKFHNDAWMLMNVSVLLGGLLAMRLLKTILTVIEYRWY